MTHLRTHVVKLSIGLVATIAAGVGVGVAVADAPPTSQIAIEEAPAFQAADLRVAPAPLPATDHGQREDALADRAEVVQLQAEAEARRAAEAAAQAEAEREAAREAERRRQEQQQAAAAPAQPSGSVWDRLAQCESGGNWAYNGSSGYDGGLQFHPNTWNAYKPSGYPAYAYQASREQQIAVAERVLASQGWDAWPACSRKLGLR